MNDRIRVREVRVVDADGTQLGVLTTEKALARAKEQGLDLVEVAAKSRPPVCKIMDFGKYKYELKLKKRQNAKKQHKVVLKEVRLRPKTGEHDYQVKIKHARRFLLKGCKVQVNVLFRGRERAHTDIARGHLKRMAEDLEEIAKVESPAKMEGYRMIMILAPTPNAAKVAAKERKEKEAETKKGKKGKKGKSKGSASESSADALSDSEIDLEESDDTES